MRIEIEELIKEYENNIGSLSKYQSFTNDVREYKGYIFKKSSNIDRYTNEIMWLKKLNEYKYPIPRFIGTDNQEIIVMNKIDGQTLCEDDAKKHFYNIGKLMAELHNIHTEVTINWKENILNEYIEIKESVADIMEYDIFNKATQFIENHISKIDVTDISIIHKDIRPENVIYIDNKYYLIDLENMGIGDSEYDFTRILSLLNQKNFYQYEDFKNLMDGYRTVKNIKLCEEKWILYSKFYAFRIYARMLIGRLGRSEDYEIYLRKELKKDTDRVVLWIKKYNEEIGE